MQLPSDALLFAAGAFQDLALQVFAGGDVPRDDRHADVPPVRTSLTGEIVCST